MFKLQNVKKVHLVGEVQTTALDGINLAIAAGEYVAVSGPSGCGKSTLLSLLGLLDVADSGDLSFDGASLKGLGEPELNRMRRGRIGFIFQNFNLIEELSVLENVELALEYSTVSAKERSGRALAVLERLGVAHRANHRPSQLSGGQQQRVAIARALIAEPAVLLADEPTGNLDTAHGDEVMRILREINDAGTTVVMVTHSPEHARQARRIIELLDGRIVDDNVNAVPLVA
jgi:putative ABC transport system ATP-binding protein